MRLSPVLAQRLSEATQAGIEEGMRRERRVLIENLLIFRFGSLDDQLSAIVEPLLELSTEEFSRLILQLSNLSREELLARFGSEPQ